MFLVKSTNLNAGEALGKNEYNEYNHIAFISYTNGIGEEVETDILSKTAPNNLTEADKIIAIKNINSNSYEKEKEQLYNGTIPDFIQLLKKEETQLLEWLDEVYKELLNL